MSARTDDADWREAFAQASSWHAPTFPLSGTDVLALGLKPGARVGVLLDAIETEWSAQDFAGDRTALLTRLAELVAGGDDGA